MKIIRISTRVVNARMRNWVFVKVETDEGVTGWGEASLEWKTRAVVGCVEDLAPLVLGEDPRRIEHLYQIMYRHSFFRMGVIGMSALSGIEQACWDIWGKSLGVPVYQLLGGAVRDSIRMYDHLGGGEMSALYLQDQPEQMADRARESIAAGYTAIKALVVPLTEPLDSMPALRHAERCMAAIRDAVGDDVDIMVDVHGRTTPAMAIQYGQALAPYRLYFFEEPCPAENVAGMAQVARALPGVPIAAGERLVTRFAFRELLERGACAVVQPDLCHCGGLWEARKIAAMAETYYVSIAPHNPLGPIATAANVQFGFATPNFLIQEAIRSDVPWRDEVVTTPVTVVDGHVGLPERPGLGIEVNEAEAARHPFEQETLMQTYHRDHSVADW
ncbi:MAG: galactonate dehydratase [Thermomicrobiales bacterium]|nr:galactonate dehydratase [Thermomicrobiales bacterium]